MKSIVTNTPSSSDGEGLVERVEKMEDKMVELEKVYKVAKSAAGSASNGLDLVKKRVGKLEKKDRGQSRGG